MAIYMWRELDTRHFATQGPCPDEFHVPLYTELQALYNAGISLGAWTASNGNGFKTCLKMPFAGQRNYKNTNTALQGTLGTYYSATWGDSNTAETIGFQSSGVWIQNQARRSAAFPIRGFRNKSVTPDSNWTVLKQGTGTAGIYHNSTLGLISISSDGTTWLTIADKNLGATTVWNSGNTLSEANCGKYYQWGNNYGFPRTGTIANQSTTQVDASSYGPGNYYSSDTFIKYSGRWDTTDNGNLWGGVTGIQTVSGNLVLGDKLYKIVTSTTAPASGTASNIITFVTE